MNTIISAIVIVVVGAIVIAIVQGARQKANDAPSKQGGNSGDGAISSKDNKPGTL